MKPDVAIIGAGYVGVPLAQVFAEAGKRVVLVDVQQSRVDAINRGESYIEDVPGDVMAKLVADGLSATTDYDVLREADAILIALPTPLSRQREPDLSIVKSAVAQIAPRLRKGHLVVLESTTYPGTTREEVLPLLESTGLVAARTSSSRSRRSASIRAAPTSPRRTSRRSSAGSRRPAPSARPSCTPARSTRCTASPRRRRPS